MSLDADGSPESIVNEGSLTIPLGFTANVCTPDGVFCATPARSGAAFSTSEMDLATFLEGGALVFVVASPESFQAGIGEDKELRT